MSLARSKTLIKSAFLSAVAVVSFTVPQAFADTLPPELIPPDVTLSPNASTPQVTPTTSTQSTPGLGGQPSANPGNQPSPPPQGSSSKFSGFPNVPPGVPQGHKGMPLNMPTGQQPQQPGTSAPQANDPIAVIETNRGVIAIRLFQQFAPKTVEAFVEMVNQGFYNGLTWHRVEPGFVIQGGCPKGNGTGMYIDPKTNQPRMLMLESGPSVRHNMPGVVAMAHFPKNPHSASCQFYITLKAQPSLDFKYTIFGGVISGMDVVMNIQKGDQIQSIRIQQPQ